MVSEWSGKHGNHHNQGGDDQIPTVMQLLTAGLVNELTPPQITADQNDYGPDGYSGANCWRLSTDALRSLTGLQGGVADRVVVLENIGTNSLTLKHETTSTTANRFTLPDATDQVLVPSAAAILRYDSQSLRWRLLSLVTDVAAINAVLITLASEVGTLQTDVSSLQSSRTTDEARITTLESFEALFKSFRLGASQQLTSNSTTLQNITGAKLTGAAGEEWAIDWTILFNCTAAADFKMGFTGPPGAILFATVGFWTDATGTAQPGVALGLSGVITAQGDGGTHAIQISGRVVFTSNGGDLQLQAAQNTATVENTDFVVLDTSFSARKVA